MSGSKTIGLPLEQVRSQHKWSWWSVELKGVMGMSNNPASDPWHGPRSSRGGKHRLSKSTARAAAWERTRAIVHANDGDFVGRAVLDSFDGGILNSLKCVLSTLQQGPEKLDTSCGIWLFGHFKYGRSMTSIRG